MGTIRGILIRKSDDWYRFNRIVYPLTDTLTSFYNEHGGLAAAKAARHVEDEATMARACACLSYKKGGPSQWQDPLFRS